VSVIIDDFDVLGPGLGPPEADAVLIVDPDRMLPGAIPLQLLEAEPGKREGTEGDARVQAVQPLRTFLVQAPRKRPAGGPGVFAVEDILGAPILERRDRRGRRWQCPGLMLDINHSRTEGRMQGPARVTCTRTRPMMATVPGRRHGRMHLPSPPRPPAPAPFIAAPTPVL
jgi:hypothetical protein